MKKILLIILVLITISNCTNNIENDNVFSFISTKDTLPILNLKIKEHPDSTRIKMCDMYGLDLCEKCELIKFKIPLEIEKRNGFIEVLVDFNTPYCSNCPPGLRYRNYYQISINKSNRILVEGMKLLELDTLQKDIEKYLMNKETYDNSINIYDNVLFFIKWDLETNREYIDSIIKLIYQAHLNVVVKELKKKNIDFYTLSKESINDLKKEFPLRIELDFGKTDRIMIVNVKELE